MKESLLGVILTVNPNSAIFYGISHSFLHTNKSKSPYNSLFFKGGKIQGGF
jgi:hypothetical protein